MRTWLGPHAAFTTSTIVGVAVLCCFPCVAAAYSSSDIIATYAGNGSQGYSGDGGAAVAAALDTPEYVATDAAGNLYLSDRGSHTIRKVDVAGLITTIAGTGTAGYNGDDIPAITAQLNNPAGLAFDQAGDLYVADAANNRIRKITLSTGTISTVAGTGGNGCVDANANSAVFSGPVGLAFDSNGSLYISEAVNRIVRKLSGGIVSSFAGSCTQKNVFASPYGLMTDPSDNVYVADEAPSPIVWKYDSAGSRTAFAGNGANGNTGDGSAATSATLTDPQGLARDAAGDVFIGSGNVVRVVTMDGIIHAAVGNGSSGYSGDGGPATSAELRNVKGLAMNTAGRLFVSDLSTAPRLRITGPAAPLLVNVAGAGVPATNDGIVSADGRIDCPETCGANYVSGMPVILDALATSPDVLYEWKGGACNRGDAACTLFPQTLAPTLATAYFTTWYIKTLFGGSVGPALHSPFALTFDTIGNLYFTETATCTVRRRSPAGSITAFAGNGICGNLGDGMQATQAELSNPRGVAVDVSGNVYIQDTGNGSIRKVTGDGVLHTFATSGILSVPSPALVVSIAGDLFTLGQIEGQNGVVRVTADGVAHPFATLAASAVVGLARGIIGGFVVSSYEGNFTFLDAQGNVTGNVILPSFQNQTTVGMAVDGHGRPFGTENCALWPIPNFSGAALNDPYSCSYNGDGGPAAAAGLNGAVGLAFDANGWLYVADTGSNAVRVLYPDAIFTDGCD